MTDAVAVFITAANDSQARAIAEALVAEQLAACVSIVTGVDSVYRWQGAVTRAREVLLIAKTLRALVDELAARVTQLHSYEVPEIVSLPIDGGSPAYLAWISASVTRALKK